MRKISAAATAFFIFAAFSASAQTLEDIFVPMSQELDRAMKELKFEDYPSPYFISLRISRQISRRADFRDGDLESHSNETDNYFVPAVRVGQYSFDQSQDAWGGSGANYSMVLNAGPKVLRHHIWAALDSVYKDACSLYLTKKAKRSAEGIPEYATDDFTVEKPEVFLETNHKSVSDLDSYEKILSKASENLGRDPKVLKSLIRFNAMQNETHLLTSEGTKMYQRQNLGTVYLSLYGKSLRGLPLHITQMYISELKNLPNEKDLNIDIRSLKELYYDLLSSSEAQGGLAPCLMDPAAAGQLFIAFTQRLEGERQRDPNEPQTFRDKRGSKILPSFLTLTDDPLLDQLNGVSLIGSYRFDEEGVRAQQVMLVQKGVLKNFLMSRRPVKGYLALSNGHGRCDPSYPAHARAANLIVQSSQKRTKAQLRSLLLEEVKKRRVPFGVIIEGLEPIRQDTSTGAHQTFRGAPQRMTLLYPDGKEILVHHGEVVGTPIKLTQSIIATGDDDTAQNFMAPGRSGTIPSSVVSPSILVAEIEIQKGSARPMRLPILESPLK